MDVAAKIEDTSMTGVLIIDFNSIVEYRDPLQQNNKINLTDFLN